MARLQSITQLTKPTELPLSLAEVKEHLRVDFTDEDTLITTLINAANDFVAGRNGFTGRTLVSTQWKADYDKFSDTDLILPFPPIKTVDSITYLDGNGDEQTLSSTVYKVLNTEPVQIVRKADQDWPETRDEKEAVSITFTSGYVPISDSSPTEESEADSVPAPIKAAILLIVGDLYHNREAQTLVSGAKYEINHTVKALLNPYRVDNGI